MDLLAAYRIYPEYAKDLDKGVETFSDVDEKSVAVLPDKVLQSRYGQFNKDFLTYRALEKTTSQQLQGLSKRLWETPLSDVKHRGDLEIKVRALEDRQKQVRKLIFILSVQANVSVLEALKTVSPEKRATAMASAKPVDIPKLPGIFGGSRAERLKMSEAEKINLTPIDDEFYGTQLGKKLESDLGGRADAWSYDYDADELYVVVDKEVGKVRVKQDSPGVRYIQTRVGGGFSEPRGSDTKVDMLQAKGKLLTGDAREETLFGRMPSPDDRPRTNAPTTPSTPASGDGH